MRKNLCLISFAFFFWTVTVSGSQQCGVKVSAGKIVGGVDSGGYHYPWLAVVRLEQPQSRMPIPICGGSLITNSYVLTAAHCLVINPAFTVDLYSVDLGVYDICSDNEATREAFKVSDMVVHERYRKKGKFYDIGLMKLSRPSRATPVCLPILGVPDITEGALLIGFGVTGENSNSPCHLLEVNVTKYSSRDCMKTQLPTEDTKEDSVFCAGSLAGDVDSCYGDSGGPLMTQSLDGRYTVAGIVSYGYGCATPGVPGIYTNVGKYLNWINDKLSRSNTRNGVVRVHDGSVAVGRHPHGYFRADFSRREKAEGRREGFSTSAQGQVHILRTNDHGGRGDGPPSNFPFRHSQVSFPSN